MFSQLKERWGCVSTGPGPCFASPSAPLPRLSRTAPARLSTCDIASARSAGASRSNLSSRPFGSSFLSRPPKRCGRSNPGTSGPADRPRGLGERAGADLIAAAPLVDGFSEQQELVGGEARHERPEGVRSSHMDLSHPPERPHGRIVAKQRSGWALGQILCLAGKGIAFGDRRAPGNYLLSKLLDFEWCVRSSPLGILRL